MTDPRAILTYHSLDDSGAVISLPPAVFGQQMRNLFDRGIAVVTLEDLVQRRNLEPGHPAVALTFDDGFENFYSEACPVLAQYHFRSTVFLVSGHCGRTNDWPGQPRSCAGRRLLSWARIAELHRLGVRFGAHTMTHPVLTELSAPAAREEILNSKREIEDRIGDAVTSFAYPYGVDSAALREIVAEHFPVGCSTRLGYLRPDSPPSSVERIDVYYLSRLFWFQRLFRRSTGGYLAWRRGLRRCKSLLLP